MALRGINITSPYAQRMLRRAGLASSMWAVLLALTAYVSVFERGLFESGMLILLCIGVMGVGGFGYTQQAFLRDTVMFGAMPCDPPRTMIEPAWPLIGVTAAFVISIYMFTSA